MIFKNNFIDKYKLSDPPCKFRINKTELIVSTAAINLLSLALPIMVLQVYDRIVTNNSEDTLTILAMGVCVAILLEAILRLARAYTTGWTGMSYEYTLTANAMYKYLNANPVTLQKEGVGRQNQNLGAFAKLRNFYGGQSLINMIDIPFVFLFLLLISYIAGRLVVVPVILILIFVAFTWIMGNNLKKALEDQDKKDDIRYNFIVETLQGIHTIKACGLESVFKRRYERLEEDSSISSYEASVISSESYASGAIFNEIIVVLVISFGAPMVISGQITTGALIATVLLSGRLMQPIQRVLFLWSQFQDYRIAHSKAESIFSMKQIDRDKNIKNAKLSGKLELKNVCFKYGESEVFHKLNLKVKAKEVISIHGPNDSGRSTLLRLIAGIFEADSGEILIDGIESYKFTSEEIVKNIGLIESESIIFQGTIMQNLTAFDSSKEEQAIELAEFLNIDKDIALLPQGYDTQIKDGFADTIAPGVKQRISIVRVLLNKPKIILFNNADQGLDREGYNYLVNFLTSLKGKVTMIFITNDKNISDLSDRNYWLKNKKLYLMKNDDEVNFYVKPYSTLKL